jgi:type VI protein secretion system component Hcp
LALILNLEDSLGHTIIPGDSKVPGFEGLIDVLAWSWGSSFNPGNLRDITITKSYDSASLPLLQQADSGEMIGSADMFVVDTSDPTSPVIVQSVGLADVWVREIDIAIGSAPPSEEKITLR